MPGPFPIVGIGASAGGLEAVTELLKELPMTSGMAFVVMQHLDPTHESALPALLGRATTMAVTEARNNARIEPNRVYVIPPNKVMRVSRRRLKVAPRRSDNEFRMPIDHFLESLAQDEADRAIGVILSGNGSDGTRGMLAVKAAGGITFAQDKRSAKYTAMPASAIAAGCVDFVLRPGQIAEALVGLTGGATSGAFSTKTSDSTKRGDERAFEEVLAILRQRMGVDFTHYKQPTLDRRIRRRMELRKFEAMREYAEYLRGHPTEVQDLFNDILIHVTGFFRDPHVFSAVRRRILPRLLKVRTTDEPIRIWVPGCSSGEEVYSIAIVLAEALAEKKVRAPVQIFGTDINLAALDRARAGYYPAGITVDVSADRLRRFFVKSDSGYRINKSIREMCLFARQNVVFDPPFSNLDIISCRNLLIYLGPLLQRKMFPVFHYALKSNGFLMLGASETTGGFADLFTLVDSKCKFYAKKAVATRPAVTFGHGLSEERTGSIEPARSSPTLQVGPTVPEIQRQADRLVLAHYSVPGAVINQNLEVLQFRGQTGQYLQHSHGEASLNLLKMAHDGLVLDLRAAINKAIKKNGPVRQDNVLVRRDGQASSATIEVVPFLVPPSQERFFLVSFVPVPDVETVPMRQQAGKKTSTADQRAEAAELSRLREELAATRESLQAIIEEQEATNEELRSANEEIMSSNEELQSTNEELETAKEELQSTNEELTTLNDELESRNSELEDVNNDLHNLLASVNIPVVMVGTDLRIRRFTSIAEKMLNLIPGDVGRPITDIKMKIDLPRLDTLITEVIDSLQTKDLELKDQAGHWWSVRIRPYKTTDHKIDGAVVAFVDVDDLRQSFKALKSR
jgi:two-component system CheB/CheR fusion protein